MALANITTIPTSIPMMKVAQTATATAATGSVGIGGSS
jgi:hypothetical protein